MWNNLYTEKINSVLLSPPLIFSVYTRVHYSFLCKLILSRFETCKQYQKPQWATLKNRKTFSFHFIFINAQKESNVCCGELKSAKFLGEPKNRFLCLPTFFMKLLLLFVVDVNGGEEKVYKTHLNPQRVHSFIYD